MLLAFFVLQKNRIFAKIGKFVLLIAKKTKIEYNIKLRRK